MDTALSELQQAIAALENAVDMRFERERERSEIDGEVRRVHADRSRLAPVVRVVALSGGYSRVDACEKLSHNHGMIASFSRALTEDLRVTMNDAEFDASLAATIDQIYAGSVNKA